MVADMGLDELTSYLKSSERRRNYRIWMNEEDEFLRELIASGAFKIVLVDAPYHDRNTSSVWIDQKNAQYEIAKRRSSAMKAVQRSFISQGIKSPL